jgi:predicted DNA-binding transcriptional regulator AlpA
MNPISAEPILLSVDDACRALGGISRRTLWTLTNRGENSIPHVKLGARVMYARRDLLEWIEYQRVGSKSSS